MRKKILMMLLLLLTLSLSVAITTAKRPVQEDRARYHISIDGVDLDISNDGVYAEATTSHYAENDIFDRRGNPLHNADWYLADPSLWPTVQLNFDTMDIPSISGSLPDDRTTNILSIEHHRHNFLAYDEEGSPIYEEDFWRIILEWFKDVDNNYEDTEILWLILDTNKDAAREGTYNIQNDEEWIINNPTWSGDLLVFDNQKIYKGKSSQYEERYVEINRLPVSNVNFELSVDKEPIT